MRGDFFKLEDYFTEEEGKLNEALQTLPSELFSRVNQDAGVQGIRLVSDYYIEMVEELGVLRANRWEPEAQEAHVVERYLDFVCKYLSHRDVKYEVVALEQTGPL
jgi:hypothetical protein